MFGKLDGVVDQVYQNSIDSLAIANKWDIVATDVEQKLFSF